MPGRDAHREIFPLPRVEVGGSADGITRVCPDMRRRALQDRSSRMKNSMRRLGPQPGSHRRRASAQAAMLEGPCVAKCQVQQLLEIRIEATTASSRCAVRERHRQLLPHEQGYFSWGSVFVSTVYSLDPNSTRGRHLRRSSRRVDLVAGDVDLSQSVHFGRT